jgi:hypothetical protein
MVFHTVGIRVFSGRDALRDNLRGSSPGAALTAPEGVVPSGPDQPKRALARAARTRIGHGRCDGFNRNIGRALLLRPAAAGM